MKEKERGEEKQKEGKKMVGNKEETKEEEK